MRKKKRILYFDDEPFISTALAQNLELFGWNVTLVSKAEDLFGKLSEPFDVIILDIMAPIPDKRIESIEFNKKEIQQMDKGRNTGIVFATKIWDINNQELVNMPILFLSARKQPESINTFQKEGRKCACLRKPELVKTIHKKLEELLM